MEITSWNPGAERLFGYSAEEMIGQPVIRLIPEDHSDEEPQILAKLQRSERIEHYETQRVRKDGQLIDISLSVSPVKDSSGRIIGASKIARDITERRRLAAERDRLLVLERSAREEAEKASRLKDEFLSLLSHELRTPLNAILGWARVLGTQRNEDLQKRAVEVIERNAGLQARLIEELLDMSRILTGKMVQQTGPVDLNAIVDSAANSVRPAAAAKAIALDFSIDDSARSISGDPDRLQQVVWNLLSNAIKFTPSGGRVELRAQRDLTCRSPSATTARVSVRTSYHSFSIVSARQTRARPASMADSVSAGRRPPPCGVARWIGLGGK